MGRNKKYDGYTAYDYLPQGAFPRYEMAYHNPSAPPYEVPLTESQLARFYDLVDRFPYISLHEHPTCLPLDLSKTDVYTRVGRDVCAYSRLAEGIYDGVFDNMLDGTTTIVSKNGWKWEDILFDLGMRLCDLEHQSMLIRCKNVDDILRAHQTGKIALVPAVEGSALIENELDRIDVLFGFGVRLLGVAYSEGNGLASGIKEDGDGGLTKFGRQAVTRMNKVGMAIDCSHTAYRSTMDVIAHSEKPIFLTHVGAKSLWDSKRLFPDEVIRACAARGGVIGIEAAPHTTLSPSHPEHSIESYMDHVRYIADMVGVEHIAFGPDTLYGDHVGLHQAFAANLSTGETQGTVQHPVVPFVKGVENPTEASHNLLRYLVADGWSDGDIEAVLGGNVLRVLRQVWPNKV